MTTMPASGPSDIGNHTSLRSGTKRPKGLAVTEGLTRLTAQVPSPSKLTTAAMEERRYVGSVAIYGVMETTGTVGASLALPRLSPLPTG